MAAPPYDHFKKLLLLGDSGVGKTSLLLRFSDIPIGIDLSVKTIEMDNEWVKLQICDTNSQERLFKKITRACYEAADGILLVYDVTNESSFQHVRDWIRKNIHSSSNNVKKVLVGNKADMDDESKRAVSRARGQTLADVCDIMFLETSAKTNKNVEDVFFALASCT
ncbi:ras-related protein RAB1BV-like [Rosa rugosa]|uniref:ras-related protein RAB1BV-like n=1 Tax=Rosa rugosa TaxID=74645 RepID=UPI002B4066B3|nr:ras-related protein RAB1BV-like [Rosa rugosa]